MNERNNNKLIIKQKELLKSHVFDIEITTKCNKNCYMCPRRKLSRNKKNMSIKTFETLVSWLPKKSKVFFAGFGEPLLNSNLPYFIEKLSKQNISTSIMTNASMLNQKKIYKLFDKGLDLLQISVIKEDEYLINKILDYINYDFTKNDDKKIQFNLIYDTSNEDTMDKYYQYLNLKNYLTKKKKIHSRGGYNYHYQAISNIHTCGTFFAITYINVEGNIQICSNDINNIYSLGNIFTNSFEEIIQKKRLFLGNKNIAKICKKCDDEYRFIHLQK